MSQDGKLKYYMSHKMELKLTSCTECYRAKNDTVTFICKGDYYINLGNNCVHVSTHHLAGLP